VIVRRTAASRPAEVVETWADFSPREGGFSVSLPGSPTPRRHAQPSRLGRVEFQMFVLYSRGVSYAVGFADLPGAAPAPARRGEVLRGVRDGLAAAGVLRVSREKDVELAGHPGKELEGISPGGEPVRARVFLVGRRVYQLLAGRPADGSRAGEAERFFASFRLATP
jgi:hypothetical protein